MIVLAFDTCLGVVSAALRVPDVDGGVRTRSISEACESGHAERLMPLLQRLLDEAGIDARHIDLFAVTSGPGTFTGVRTGIAAARAFGLATGRPVVALSSLDVIALGARRVLGAAAQGRPILAVADARRGQLYTALMRPDDAPDRAVPQLTTAAAAASLAVTEGAVVAGPGAGLVAEAARLVGIDVEVCPDVIQPDTLDLLAVAPLLPIRDKVSPVYVRPPDATPPAAMSLARVS